MNYSFRILVLCTLTMVSSCDKNKTDKLRAEQAKNDAERASLISESEAYANQLTRLVSAGGPSLYTIGQVTDDTVKQAAALEVQAAAKMSKWLEIEQGLKELRSRVDAWKAKNLK